MQGRTPAGLESRDFHGPRSPRSERGSALIEIMMAALLVALAATAVFKGIDGASAVSSGSKSRAVAAAIAEDDQERLRALPPADLVDRSESRSVSRGGVAFTVRSSSRWAVDRDATPDCNTTTSRTGYLRIQTTVTWPDMRGSQPIVATGLVAPPNGSVTTSRGAVGIKILNEQNQGVPGVSVSVSGASLSGTTDSDGCVYWDDVPQGNYTYTAQKAGYIDYSGNGAITRPIGVGGGQTRLDSAYLDVATGMDVAVVTRRYGGAETPAELVDGGAAAPLALPLHLANAKMAALNGVRTFPASTAVSRSVTGLYPMPYGVFVGACALANNPASYGAPVQATPPYPSPFKVSVPGVNVRLRVDGTYANGHDVKYTLQPASGSTCTTTYTRKTVNVPGIGDGAIARPEMPYGRYTVCGEAYSGGAWRKASTTVANTSPAGVNVDLNVSTVQGRC